MVSHGKRRPRQKQTQSQVRNLLAFVSGGTLTIATCPFASACLHPRVSTVRVEGCEVGSHLAHTCVGLGGIDGVDGTVGTLVLFGEHIRTLGVVVSTDTAVEVLEGHRGASASLFATDSS